MWSNASLMSKEVAVTKAFLAHLYWIWKRTLLMHFSGEFFAETILTFIEWDIIEVNKNLR